MRVAFLRPSMSGRPSADALQPLLFSVIDALTPPEIDLEFFDAMASPLPERIEADAIAMSVETFSARSAYTIADRYRALGVPVVLGGYHVTACPDEAAEHADAIVVGEAEDTWPGLLADLAAGELKPRYQSGNAVPLGVLAAPTRPVFSRRDYPPLGMVQFSRGCRYTCEFCSIHAFYGHAVRTRPLDDLLAEIAARPEKVLFFTDDNLFADRARARELFGALIGMGKRWVCQISMDVAEDAELLGLMRRAGCLMVLIGFESLDAANLKQMRKGANLRAADYQRVIDKIQRAGLMIYGTFVIGYDHDRPETGRQLVDFATRHSFSIANFNPLMPMPGTGLYDRLAAEGRLLHERWWLDPGFRYGDAMFRPALMSPGELTAACRDARFGFYRVSSIGRRALRNARGPLQLGVHLAANLVSHRAIHAKQGAHLGEWA